MPTHQFIEQWKNKLPESASDVSESSHFYSTSLRILGVKEIEKIIMKCTNIKRKISMP